MIDVKPLLERNATNGIAQAEMVRDRIYDYFEQACREENVDAPVLKSPPYNDTVWLRFDCWMHHPRESGVTDRSAVVLTIRPREFHRFPWEVDIEMQDGKKTRRYFSIVEFTPDTARAIVRYLLRRNSSRQFGFKRCRWASFMLWLPKNKPARLGTNVVQRIYRGMLWGGILMILTGFSALPGLGFLLLLIAGGLMVYNYFRRGYVLSAGKPEQEPRVLIRMDSWQTVIYDLAPQAEIAKRAVCAELGKARMVGFVLDAERIWHWGVDGKEEREQIVAGFRRGLSFVHIYPYGNDLYVGWDAHVNCGTWAEKEIGQGIDRLTGELCRVNSIYSAWHVPNEYDVTDTSCLIEWTHAAATKVVKRLVEEYRIDQEIDFTILREERQGIAGRGHNSEAKAKVKSGLHFRRAE